MSVLGWCLSSESASLEGEITQLVDVALLWASSTQTTPRLRAKAQLQNAERLCAFLPAAPATALNREAALSWSSLHQNALVDRLVGVRGKVQISAQVFFAPPEPEQSLNETWLQCRARAQSVQKFQRRRVEDYLDPILQRLPTQAIRRRQFLNSIVFDLLVYRHSAERSKQVLASALAATALECAVVGPLPAYGFSDVLGAMCKTH